MLFRSSGSDGGAEHRGRNAPSDARCFLARTPSRSSRSSCGRNAPSGARCFLARTPSRSSRSSCGRDAPSGARCFLAMVVLDWTVSDTVVMHLLALGAFWRAAPASLRHIPGQVVMHLLALGAFWRGNPPVGRHLRRVVMHLLALGAFWRLQNTPRT